MCCGARSALILVDWIQIRVPNADPDPNKEKSEEILGFEVLEVFLES
jgi:hypothetical protein